MVDVNHHSDYLGTSRIRNLPNAVDPQEPATKAQLDAAVEGTSWKRSARVSTQANISLSAPGASIDGIAMASGDRVLVRTQTSQPENGIYIWNGASAAMTRSADANTADELENATVSVDEGTSAQSTFRQSTVNFTLGLSPVLWSSFGTSAPPASSSTAGILRIATGAEVEAGTVTDAAVVPATLAVSKFARRSMTQTIGDGTSTQFDVVHNFGTRRVAATVRRTSGNYDEVRVETRSIDANTLRITTVAPPANGAYEASIAVI